MSRAREPQQQLEKEEKLLLEWPAGGALTLTSRRAESQEVCLKQLAGVQRTLRGEHRGPPMCTWRSGRREHTQSQGSCLVAHEGSAPTARLRMDPGGACESAVPTVGLKL